MLILFCGWAGSGKTTLARLVSRQLGVHYVDMDDLRQVATGRPPSRPTTPAEMAEESIAMLANYGFMARVVDWHRVNHRSLVISGTFSKPTYWEIFMPVLAGYRATELRVIRCLPVGDHAAAVSEVLCTRERNGYNSSVNTVERYEEVKARFKAPPLPHFTIRTWGSLDTPAECVERIIAHVHSRDEFGSVHVCTR